MHNSEERKSLLRAAADRWRAVRERRAVKVALTLAQRIFFVAVLCYLLYRLSLVGWRDVAGGLPASPWFYGLFLLRFFALPLSEIPAYEVVWRRPLWRYVTVFVRKRVYNFAVMGYSGEAFFTLWARRRLGLPSRTILSGVKDNNILSAFASNLSTVILVAILWASGYLAPVMAALPGAAALFWLAFLSSLGLSLMVIVLRRRLLNLTNAATAGLVAIHGGRMIVVMFLHAAMYATALPGADYMAWLVFISLQLVLSRIPFLPNVDLVFLGVALSISSIVDAPEAAIAGMLVAEAALSQLINVALFCITARDARAKPDAPPPEDSSAGEEIHNAVAESTDRDDTRVEPDAARSALPSWRGIR